MTAMKLAAHLGMVVSKFDPCTAYQFWIQQRRGLRVWRRFCFLGCGSGEATGFSIGVLFSMLSRQSLRRDATRAMRYLLLGSAQSDESA
jgi:hypothetical protein